MEIRHDSAVNLFELGDPPVAQIFIEALQDGFRPGETAPKALASLGRKDTIQLIINNMPRSTSPYAAEYAKALKELTGQDLGSDVASWKSWFDRNRQHFPEQVK